MSAVAAPFPQVRIDELVWAQVERSPDAAAAVFGSESLTYRQLQRECERAAARLRELGVVRGSLVGIHLERSLEMLVVILAVMKAGGAYVPLDPDFPPQRLAYVVENSGLRLVISQSTLSGSAPPGDYRRVELDELLADTAGGAASAGAVAPDVGQPDLEQPNLERPNFEQPNLDQTDAEPAGTRDLSYVLYTSGSTGTPKGVALEHRNVVNLLLSMQREPGLTAHDRLLAVSTLSFDIAALELYLPLITGATVVIASHDDAGDGESLRALLDAHRITVMQATPTTWRLLIEAGWQGADDFKVMCGGEPMPRDLAQMLLQRCGQLWNLYGPTETCIYSSGFRITDGDAPLLIGRPIANTRIYVLDKSGHPVPTGIPGELFIAGAGVARGYLNNPGLTAEKFVHDPFWDAFGSRMYRSGDMGRFLADGNIEFRSRVDHQVKIRGFRVELGEVETAIESHPAVAQAVAKIFEVGPGDARLVAYYATTAQPLAAAELREQMRERLPRYMVPQQFVALDELPLLPNGKVNRNALALPVAGANAEAPSGVATGYAELEPRVRYLAQVWSELLATPAGPDDNFFDLGGHSMLALKMVNRVDSETGMRIKLVRLASQSLGKIAADLPASVGASAPASAPDGAAATFVRDARRLFWMPAKTQ